MNLAVVNANQVRHLFVPQYESLSIQKMLEFLVNYPAMHQYMPNHNRELSKLPREWIVCVAATIVGDAFVKFIKDGINARNAGVVEQKNLNIAINPDLLDAFNASTAVSRKFNHPC